MFGYIPKYDTQTVIEQGNAYTSSTDLNSITSGEYNYLYLKNPAGSGVSVMLTHASWGVDSNNARSILRVYANPTVTVDGTALARINTYVTSSPNVSAVECYKNPTVTASGGLLNMHVGPVNAPSRGVNRFYLVAPGNSLLVSIDNNLNNASTFIEIYWEEV